MYDLQFTLVGNYVGITDFIYDIEDDEELKFEIKNLSIQPYTTTTTTTVTESESSNQSTTEKTNPFKKIIEITSSNTSKSSGNTTTNTITNTASTGQQQNTQNNTTNSNTNNNNSTDETNKTVIYDPKWVEVTFKVENIGVTLD